MNLEDKIGLMTGDCGRTTLSSMSDTEDILNSQNLETASDISLAKHQIRPKILCKPLKTRYHPGKIEQSRKSFH